MNEIIKLNWDKNINAHAFRWAKRLFWWIFCPQINYITFSSLVSFGSIISLLIFRQQVINDLQKLLRLVKMYPMSRILDPIEVILSHLWIPLLIVIDLILRHVPWFSTVNQVHRLFPFCRCVPIVQKTKVTDSWIVVNQHWQVYFPSVQLVMHLDDWWLNKTRNVRG